MQPIFRAFVILFSLFTTCNLWSQNAKNSNVGTLKNSNLFVEGVINTNLPIEGNLVFEKIDSYSNSTQFSSYLIFYEKEISDSVEYYFVANLTKDTLEFEKLNSRLVGQDYGLINETSFRPITLFLYPECRSGIDFTPLKLYPKQILIIRSKTLKTDISNIT